MTALADFAYVVRADAEFIAKPGERPHVVCFAYKVNDAPTRALWEDELGSSPPYPIGDDSVFACFTQAELTCHLSKGWPLPAHVIDLNCELRWMANGLKLPNGHGLLGFCRWLGLDIGDAIAKDAIRTRIIQGGPFSSEEIGLILRYCASDVDVTAELLARVLPHLNLKHALHRGEFSKVSALMEHRGVPINGRLLRKIAANWDALRDPIVPKLDRAGIYVPHNDGTYHFSFDRFEDFLRQESIAWPRTEDGRLSTASKTFDAIAKGHEQLEDLRQLRHIRDKMRTIELAVGADNRNRTVLWPFKAKSGRTQPAASQWSFSPAVWVRNLIEPEPGMAIAYVDWSSMEFLIAAVLSGDPLMLALYAMDPYLAFAKHVGVAPLDATKRTHAALRDRYKTGLLAIQYGISYLTLALKLSVTEVAAREMIAQHHQLFSTYWAWADDWLHWSLDHGIMWTPIDWRCAVGETELKTRTIINWPVQSCGGDILRLACVWATRYGLKLIAPVHDAILLESPIARIDRDVEFMQDIMRRASRCVLGGYELRTDATIVRHPDHYTDSRGDEVWGHVTALLDERVGEARP
jgi:DNA polymerase I